MLTRSGVIAALRPYLALLALAIWLALAAAPAHAAPVALDPSFGRDGLARVPVPSAEEYLTPSIVARQRDGRLLVAGHLDTQDHNRDKVIVLARVDRRGRVARSFGRRGRVRLSRQGYQLSVSGIVVQADGRIVVGATLSTRPPYISPGPGSAWITLVRLHPSGSLDRSFGTDGWIQFAPERVTAPPSEPPYSIAPPGGQAALGALFELDGGRVLAAGSAWEYGEQAATVAPRGLLLRFDPDGSLDESFGPGGQRALAVEPGRRSCCFTSWARQPDGKLVAVGHGSSVYRFTANGAPDQSFGDRGVVRQTRTSFGASDLAIDRRGRVVLAWHSRFGRYKPGIDLQRLLPDGRQDRRFGNACHRRPPRRLLVSAAAPSGRGILVTGTQESDRLDGITADGRILRFGANGCYRGPAAKRLRAATTGKILAAGRRKPVISAVFPTRRSRLGGDLTAIRLRLP